MQVLEPASDISVSYDAKRQGYYARGFLISTKPTLPAPQGAFRISKETAHERVKSAIGKHFMIDHQLLENQDDGHFYGHGKEALLEGYRKKSHAVIERVHGPFYYQDGSDDFWYDYDMRLNDSGASAALQEYGAKSWNPFSVSPHLWDYPELNQDPMNLKIWDLVGVALVMKGAFGNQAVITRLCKGSSDVCYSDKGLGATLNQKCESGCTCQICRTEDWKLAQLLTSHLGKTAFYDSSKLSSAPPTGNNTMPNLSLDSNLPKTPDTSVSKAQVEIKEQIDVKEVAQLKAEIEQLKANAKLEAEKAWKDKVTSLENDAKMTTLNQIFSAEIVKDENARKVSIDKFVNEDLETIKKIKKAIDEYKVYQPTIKKTSEQEEPEPDSPDNGGEGETKATASSKKGKSASNANAETKHPLPKKDIDAKEESVGKAGSGTGLTGLQRLRVSLSGGTV